MSFSERLATAKAAPRPHRDITVSLDTDVAERRAALEEQIAKSARDQRLSATSPADALNAELEKLLDDAAGTLVTLRFRRLPGDEWNDITSRCPARLDAPVDVHYGYNMQRATIFAAPRSGVRVDGDTEVPLIVLDATPDSPAIDEWADLFSVISGIEFARIEDAIFGLNVFEPTQQLNELSKRSGARRN